MAVLLQSFLPSKIVCFSLLLHAQKISILPPIIFGAQPKQQRNDESRQDKNM